MATAPRTDVSAAALSAALAAPAVEKDEFADAFAKFATPEETPAPAVVEGQEQPAAQVEGAEPASEIEGAPEAGAEGEGEPELPLEGGEGEKPAAKPAKAAKEAPAPADEALTRLADMIAQRQPQPQPQAQAQVQAQAQAQPLYTPTEVTKLTEFYKEWPEVAPAVEIIVRGAITQTTNHIFAEMAKVLGPKMALLDQLADGYQDGLLREVVPDYDDTIPEQVSAWIKGQPKYLQAAYSNVMNEGTVDEINDLVSRYRQETGTAAPADRTSEGTPQAPAKPAATLSTAAKKAAAALAPVSSKRAAVIVGAPQTFDEAFDFHANRKAG